MKKESRFFDYALIVTFLIGLFVPLILMNNHTESLIEKRKFVPFPEWTWSRETFIIFPQKFQEYFNDHFGFRDRLAQSYYLLGVLLGISLNPSVIVGKDLWLFYIASEDGNNLEDYRKNDPFTLQELQQWKLDLEIKYYWLRTKGIKYLFVIVPNKQSIYPEYYPTRIRQVGKQSRLDQLMEYMKGSDVPILDLRQILIQAKPDGQVYHKTDTHWNNFGADAAQYEIMQYFAKEYSNIRPIRYSAKEFLWDKPQRGDMANVLNLSEILQDKVTPVLYNPLIECEKQMIGEESEDSFHRGFITNCHSSSPSVLIFRDSFFTALQPYISQYFSKSLYVWKRPDIRMVKEFVEQHAPDIVIEERVERYLQFIPTL